MRRPTRTVMGDDPRGGEPAVIDIWANRDVGKIDATLMRKLAEKFGTSAVKGLQIDGDGISETDYEYGAEFYNDQIKWLNKNDIDGGNWTETVAQFVRGIVGNSVEMAAIDGIGGFVINGGSAYEANGRSVNGAGDVNGDGYADVIVGAPRFDSGQADEGGEEGREGGRQGSGRQGPGVE